MSTPVSATHTDDTVPVRPSPLVKRVFGEPRFHTEGDIAGRRVRRRRHPVLHRRGRAAPALGRRRQVARPALPQRPRNAVVLQPDRDRPRQRQRRSHPLERGQRTAHQPHRATGRPGGVGHRDRVRRRRPHRRQRARRREGPVLGRGLAEVPRRDSGPPGPAEQEAGLRDRVLAERPVPRDRRRRPGGARVGTPIRTNWWRSSRATPTASRRWHGRPIPNCSSRPAGTRRPARGARRTRTRSCCSTATRTR